MTAIAEPSPPVQLPDAAGPRREPPADEPSMSASPIDVSIVLPCLDESATVGICVHKALACLERLGVRGEVVVADNGSTDGSREVATVAGARVIDVPARGYGSALAAG